MRVVTVILVLAIVVSAAVLLRSPDIPAAPASVPAVNLAVVDLVELVAAFRIVEKISEVRKQAEVIANSVGRRLQLAAGECRPVIE